MEIKQILVTTDFSENARSAYTCAVDLCRKFDARLHLTHFAGVLPPVVEDVCDVPYYEKLEEALNDEAKKHFEDFPVITHLRKVRWTPEQLRSLQHDSEIDLVVMSTHGRTGMDRFLLGSFAERVVRNSTAPVLVYRPSDRLTEFKPQMVIVPFDFSDTAEAALPMVRYLDSVFHCHFRFVYVHEPKPDVRYPIIDEVRAFFGGSPQKKIEERFAKFAADQLPGVDASFDVCEGIPSEEIVTRVDVLNADLVVLGTIGTLGSVAQALTREAACSVLVVPQSEIHKA